MRFVRNILKNNGYNSAISLGLYIFLFSTNSFLVAIDSQLPVKTKTKLKKNYWF